MLLKSPPPFLHEELGNQENTVDEEEEEIILVQPPTPEGGTPECLPLCSNSFLQLSSHHGNQVKTQKEEKLPPYPTPLSLFPHLPKCKHLLAGTVCSTKYESYIYCITSDLKPCLTYCTADIAHKI